MNRFAQALAKVCRESLLAEKWLITPSLRVGHQWLDAIVREGQPAVNVRINTIKSLALELAAPEMAAKGASLIAADGAAILVDSIASRLLHGESGYLSNLQPSAGLVANDALCDRSHSSGRHGGQNASAGRVRGRLPRPRMSADCFRNTWGNSMRCDWWTTRLCSRWRKLG